MTPYYSFIFFIVIFLVSWVFPLEASELARSTFDPEDLRKHNPLQKIEYEAQTGNYRVYYRVEGEERFWIFEPATKLTAQVSVEIEYQWELKRFRSHSVAWFRSSL